jgi:hypothetical protein
MPSIDRLSAEGENIIENGGARFEKSVTSIELAIAKEVRKLFDVIDVSGGKITTNKKAIEFLASLNNRIREALKEGGYNTKVADLLKNFDTIKANTIKLTEIANNVSVTQSSLSDIQRIEVQSALDKLVGSGIDAEFINPMRDALYRNIAFGGTVADAEQIISNYVVSNPEKQSVLARYSGQIARDTISQFDGAIQSAIGNELDLRDYLYVGSIITDSRAQCEYWVTKKILTLDELAIEINTASSKPPGYLGDQKCSGMIPGTNIDNFSVYRGGYNCRHRAIRINAARFKK